MIYLTVPKWMNAVENVCITAKMAHWLYGDSHTLPPCSDKPTPFISCDRMIARAFWNLGLTDQPGKPGTTCGITVMNMEPYLLAHGFTKINSKKNLKKGDIVLMKKKQTATPTAEWHTFVLTAYDSKTGICSKFDEGSQARINAGGFFANVPLEEWASKEFYCGFRIPTAPDKKKEIYTRSFKAVYKGVKGSNVRLLQKLLRYANCRGKDGKALTVDGVAGENTIYAINYYQTRKRKRGIELGTDGKNDGICGSKMWQTMIG